MSNSKFRESESPACKEIRYFHEEWPKEEEILAIGLKMSKLHKAERNNLNNNTNTVKGQ
tara:strand:+ start:10373 stop:10549 length:177 start_codon:yes stop_codon:yes gene_type:complete